MNHISRTGTPVVKYCILFRQIIRFIPLYTKNKQICNYHYSDQKEEDYFFFLHDWVVKSLKFYVHCKTGVNLVLLLSYFISCVTFRCWCIVWKVKLPIASQALWGHDHVCHPKCQTSLKSEGLLDALMLTVMTNLTCCVFRKSPPLFYGWLQQFLPQHEETDGTHEASSQTQHILSVSSILRLYSP